MKLLPEWHPQSAIMLTWPHRYSDWAPYLEDAEQTCLAIAEAVSARQQLLITCYDKQHLQQVSALLRKVTSPENILYAVAPSNDTWVRDYGPLSAVDEQGKVHLLDYRFNAWGGKFPAELDDAVSQHLHREGIFGTTQMDRRELVLEGGSIEVNGQGQLLTTQRCLLSDTRNPQLSRDQLQAQLIEELGLTGIHWLSAGEVEGDDTDAHIDTLARFADDNTILYISCEDRSDPHFAPLNEMRTQLESLQTPGGKAYRLQSLPIPKAIYFDGRRLPATHANFLIINDAVLLPTYGDPTDDIATRVLNDCFPGRDIICIDCLPLIRQSGSLHCMTMQLAQGVDLQRIVTPEA